MNAASQRQGAPTNRVGTASQRSATPASRVGAASQRSGTPVSRIGANAQRQAGSRIGYASQQAQNTGRMNNAARMMHAQTENEADRFMTGS